MAAARAYSSAWLEHSTAELLDPSEDDRVKLLNVSCESMSRESEVSSVQIRLGPLITRDIYISLKFGCLRKKLVSIFYHSNLVC